MGLFSKKSKEPIVHPDRTWRIHVPAPPDAVEAGLHDYDQLSGQGNRVDVAIATEGSWSTVVLTAALHPWAFHNLVLWLVDVAPGVIAVAEPCDGHRGYWLVDDEHDSWLSGYDDGGTSITVSVPTNDVVTGEALSHPAATATQALAGRGVPAALHAVVAGAGATVALEDPGRDLNPTADATFPSRSRMEDAGRIIGF